MAYPLEALLRPAYELRAAAVSGLAAVVVLWSPSTFLLTSGYSWVFAGGLIGHALWRGCAGLKILGYRANLRRQRRYVLSSSDIPCSGGRLFLGRGFRWDQRHTQRLHEVRLPERQALLRPGLSERVAAVLRRLPETASAVGGDGVDTRRHSAVMGMAQRMHQIKRMIWRLSNRLYVNQS